MKGRTTHRARRAQAPRYELPPLVAALFVAVNGYVSEAFARALDRAPAVLDALNMGADWRHLGLIESLSQLDAARATAEQHPEIADQDVSVNDTARDGMARAVALLNRVDEDLTTALTRPVLEAGFNVGFALASYVLTSEQPRRITFTQKAGQ